MGEPVTPVSSLRQDRHTGALPSVYFGFGEYMLTDAARAALDRQARWLRAHPDASVRIAGVCDPREQALETSPLLVYRRALSVRNGLVRLGIEPDRLAVKFEGPSAIAGRIAPALEHSMNRRVDVERAVAGRPARLEG